MLSNYMKKKGKLKLLFMIFDLNLKNKNAHN